MDILTLMLLSNEYLMNKIEVKTMKKRIISYYFIFTFLFNLFSEDTNFEKYTWTYNKNSFFDTVLLEKIIQNNTDSIYKIYYHRVVDESVVFDLFNYQKPYFKKINSQKEFTQIPLFKFNSMEMYLKKNNIYDIEGSYESKENVPIDSFTIKKVKKNNYKFKILLGQEEFGYHLLYLKNNTLYSDATFGTFHNEVWDEIQKIDHSENFYIQRDYLTPNKNDDFYIEIIENESFTELDVHKFKGILQLKPREIFLSEKNNLYVLENSKIYNTDSITSDYVEIKKQIICSNLKNNNDWVEINDKITKWFYIETEDGITGWVTGNSLYFIQ